MNVLSGNERLDVVSGNEISWPLSPRTWSAIDWKTQVEGTGGRTALIGMLAPVANPDRRIGALFDVPATVRLDRSTLTVNRGGHWPVPLLASAETVTIDKT